MNQAFTIFPEGASWSRGHEILRVETWGPHAFRVRATPLAQFPELPGALLRPDSAPLPTVTESSEGLVLRNGDIRVHLGRDGRLAFYRNSDDALLLAEPPVEILHPGGRGFSPAGGDLSRIEARYADATGHPPPLPHWATGFWQSKLRYKTQDELLRVAREYKSRGLPLSVIVIDFFHWPMMGDLCFDPADWPDSAGMVRDLHDIGVEVMVSVWPSFNPNSPNCTRFRDAGFLLRTEHGSDGIFPFIDTRPEGQVMFSFYDPSHPDARSAFWKDVKQNYWDAGIRIFWLDACEPEMVPVDHANLRFHIGPGAAVASLYPLLHQQGIWEGMKAAGQNDIVTLSRSAWAGSQRYGTAVWSGDIKSTFAVLRDQIRAGLHMAISGIPWWTTDIGGFHSGDPRTPTFRELIVRWFQYGTFCPLFRIHGVREPVPSHRSGGADNEVWSFGEEAYPILCEYLHLRERLRPYIDGLMDQAHRDGIPPMRPLFLEFPDDPQAWDIGDAFLLGPDLLVAPVVEEGARSRRVYLPEGATWTHAWTGRVLASGWHNIDAPLEQIPLFLRDGARLPIVPKV